LYPVLFLGALTSDSPKVVQKFGPLSGSLVVVTCGLKCLRGSFSDASTQYLVLVFAVLFFQMDYSGATETFLIDYFFMGIVFSKTYEFLLKVCKMSLMLSEYMSMSISRVRDLTAPMHLGLKDGPLYPLSNQGSPEALLKLQMAPRLIL